MTYVAAGAEISKCGRYRYKLWREWRLKQARWYIWKDAKGHPVLDGAGKLVCEPEICVFIMLNPSTADGETDDATIRKCVKFAKRLGYNRMEVINLFAHRATDPRALLALNHDDDPVGPDNRRYFSRMNDTRLHTMFICAWGEHGYHLDQYQTALGWLDGKKFHALGFTKSGQPRHPLYLPDASPLLSYDPPVR